MHAGAMERCWMLFVQQVSWDLFGEWWVAGCREWPELARAQRHGICRQTQGQGLDVLHGRHGKRGLYSKQEQDYEASGANGEM